jgi:hypothetical protein
MQHANVAWILGIKRKGWVAHSGIGQLIPNCPRVFPPLSFDHSVFLVPERLRDRPEYMILVLRLN